MKLYALAIVILAGAFTAAIPRNAMAAPAPSASSSPDPQVMARAKDWLHRLETANIDRSQLNSQMSAFLTDDTAKKLAAQLGPLGDPTKFEYVSQTAQGDYTIYTYRATFKAGTLNETFALDKAGKIAGLRLIPVQ